MHLNNDLQQFAHQLASWAEQIILNGRTPFRRVDLIHKLHTSAGICTPPLIFWINRQSMIAGGVLFLPESNAEASFPKEAAAAASLGLRHFVTWEVEKINIWEALAEGNILIKSLPLTKTQDPGVYHHRLYEVIDQLKLLSVTGRMNGEEIPSYYLLNLLEETLTLSYPPLLEFVRVQQSEDPSIITAEKEALNWNRLTMIRLLSLLHWDLLPANVPMDQLASFIQDQLSSLPDPLGQLLLNLRPESKFNLPEESAIAYHHLLLRLQQVRWKTKDNRGEQTLRLLMNLWHGNTDYEAQSSHNRRLMLHSKGLAPNCSHEISYSGDQLAANCLMRVLDNQPHPTQQQGDTFKSSQPFKEKYIHANFFGSQRPSLSIRREIAGHLRQSWPNRRLNIPGNLPFWVSEATHLLGLAGQNCLVELHLPSNWLQLLIDTFFTELLFTNYVLVTIDCRDEKRHLLKLCRKQDALSTECLLSDSNRRLIDLGMDHNQAAGKLLYTITLPSIYFSLMTDQQLVLFSEAEVETLPPQALAHYAQSSMGQQLWKLRTESAIPETTEKLLSEGIALNWLIPEATYLKELSLIEVGPNSGTIKAQVNKQLSLLFDISTESTSIPLHMKDEETSEPKQISRSLREELLQILEIEGIPRFPQTYLYRQETGPLISYNFSPPLKLQQELLGQYEFEDAKGQHFQVTGEETKEALQLASLLGITTLDIPEDRQQTAEMLNSYRQELQELQETIIRLCHQHIEQFTAAQRMQKKLWQQLPLPPLKWLSS